MGIVLPRPGRRVRVVVFSAAAGERGECELTAAQDLDGAPVLLGFRIRPAELWQRAAVGNAPRGSDVRGSD